MKLGNEKKKNQTHDKTKTQSHRENTAQDTTVGFISSAPIPKTAQEHSGLILASPLL